jgi:hypothetical protein
MDVIRVAAVGAACTVVGLAIGYATASLASSSQTVEAITDAAPSASLNPTFLHDGRPATTRSDRHDGEEVLERQSVRP